MIIRDKKKNGENSRVTIFAIKSFLSMRNLTGNSTVLFSSLRFLLWSKIEFDNFTYEHFRSFWTLWKPTYMHDTNIVRLVDNFNFFLNLQNVFLYIWFFENLKIQNYKFWNFEIATLYNSTFCIFWSFTI